MNTELLYKKIDAALSEKPRIIVGIDGPAASGKTTLASQLQEKYDCAVIHMDDFFLPLSLRTPERYKEPGGNIHYERFYQEAVMPLKAGNEFSYRIFDCSKLDYNGTSVVKASSLTVVEGSYSMHPMWQDMYNIKVMLQISPQEQLERLKDRISKNNQKNKNGKEILHRFIDTWIPLESAYFRWLTMEPDLIL